MISLSLFLSFVEMLEHNKLEEVKVIIYNFSVSSLWGYIFDIAPVPEMCSSLFLH